MLFEYNKEYFARIFVKSELWQSFQYIWSVDTYVSIELRSNYAVHTKMYRHHFPPIGTHRMPITRSLTLPWFPPPPPPDFPPSSTSPTSRRFLPPPPPPSRPTFQLPPFPFHDNFSSFHHNAFDRPPYIPPQRFLPHWPQQRSQPGSSNRAPIRDSYQPHNLDHSSNRFRRQTTRMQTPFSHPKDTNLRALRSQNHDFQDMYRGLIKVVQIQHHTRNWNYLPFAIHKHLIALADIINLRPVSLCDSERGH